MPPVGIRIVVFMKPLARHRGERQDPGREPRGHSTQRHERQQRDAEVQTRQVQHHRALI